MSRFSEIMRAAAAGAQERETHYKNVRESRQAESQKLATKADLAIDNRRGRKVGAVKMLPTVLMAALLKWRKKAMLSQDGAARVLGIPKQLYVKHETYGLKLVQADYYKRLVEEGVDLPAITETE